MQWALKMQRLLMGPLERLGEKWTAVTYKHTTGNNQLMKLSTTTQDLIFTTVKNLFKIGIERQTWFFLYFICLFLILDFGGSVKQEQGTYCRQYKSIACFFFPWLPIFLPTHILMLSITDFGSCYTHFGPVIGT